MINKQRGTRALNDWFRMPESHWFLMPSCSLTCVWAWAARPHTGRWCACKSCSWSWSETPQACWVCRTPCQRYCSVSRTSYGWLWDTADRPPSRRSGWPAHTAGLKHRAYAALCSFDEGQDVFKMFSRPMKENWWNKLREHKAPIWSCLASTVFASLKMQLHADFYYFFITKLLKGIVPPWFTHAQAILGVYDVLLSNEYNLSYI